MKYYSASTRGFYDSDIHGSRMPLDCVELTEAQWQGLIAENAKGKEIVSDERGFPFSILIESNTPKNARSFRNAELRRTDVLVLRHREEQELDRKTTLSKEQFFQLLFYRQSLREWPGNENFPSGRPRPPDGV